MIHSWISNPGLRQQSQQYRSLLEQLSTRLESCRESLKLQETITSDLATLYEQVEWLVTNFSNGRVQEAKAEGVL